MLTDLHFFEDWDFFKIGGKKSLDSIGNGAKFLDLAPENTKKSLDCHTLQGMLSCRGVDQVIDSVYHG